MIVIGITGPTGAGKTTALRVLESLGVRVLDCDVIYHRLLKSSTSLRREIIRRFGPVFDGARLDRQRLGRMVWGDQDALRDLNAITHKYILEQLGVEIADARKAGLAGVAIDAVALLESGAGRLCDVTVAVTAPEEVRVRRIMLREKISREYAQSRVDAQKKAEWFTAHCGHTLVNDSTEEVFRERARTLFQTLLEFHQEEKESCQNKRS